MCKNILFWFHIPIIKTTFVCVILYKAGLKLYYLPAYVYKFIKTEQLNLINKKFQCLVITDLPLTYQKSVKSKLIGT